MNPTSETVTTRHLCIDRRDDGSYYGIIFEWTDAYSTQIWNGIIPSLEGAQAIAGEFMAEIVW